MNFTCSCPCINSSSTTWPLLDCLTLLNLLLSGSPGVVGPACLPDLISWFSVGLLCISAAVFWLWTLACVLVLFSSVYPVLLASVWYQILVSGLALKIRSTLWMISVLCVFGSLDSVGLFLVSGLIKTLLWILWTLDLDSVNPLSSVLVLRFLLLSLFLQWACGAHLLRLRSKTTPQPSQVINSLKQPRTICQTPLHSSGRAE